MDEWRNGVLQYTEPNSKMSVEISKREAFFELVKLWTLFCFKKELAEGNLHPVSIRSTEP